MTVSWQSRKPECNANRTNKKVINESQKAGKKIMMEKNAKIYVAGHRGMVGSAIVRELKKQGYTNIITRTHAELDLCRQDAVEGFFARKGRSMFSWQLQRLAVLWQIRLPWQILCMTI